MTTAHLAYATNATIGLALGWRVIFCWFKWWLAPIIASARKKASRKITAARKRTGPALRHRSLSGCD